MSAVSLEVWLQLRASLSAELNVIRPLPLAALPVGTKLLRVGHTQVRKLSDLPVSATSRRIWLQTANPSRRDRPLSDVYREVLNMWHDLCVSGDGLATGLLAPLLSCDAFADACADAKVAGIGGYVRLPDGRQLCFQHSMSPATLAPGFRPMLILNIISHRGNWLLNSPCYGVCSGCLVPVICPHAIFRTDNSASESACWKGLSMANGMCVLLGSFFLKQCQYYSSVHAACVPGFLNGIADRPSRGSPPEAMGFSPDQRIDIPWSPFPTTPVLSHFPADSPMPSFL